jgi:hypothetical protein
LRNKKKRNGLFGIDPRQSGGVKSGARGKRAMKSTPSAAATRTVASKPATITYEDAKVDNVEFSERADLEPSTKPDKARQNAVGGR